MKKILAVVMAASIMLVAVLGSVSMAETTVSGTDVPAIQLTLDPNGGEGEKIVVTPVDGKVTLPECTFVKNNFNFVDWNTETDGTGDSFKPGDVVTLEAAMTLYANWLHKDAVIIEYTVTYDANGGEGETIDFFSPYMEGTYAYAAWNEFTYGDAIFVEWNTKPDGTGTSYAEDEMFEINGDVVLYAIWDGVPTEGGEGGNIEIPEDVSDTDLEEDHLPMGEASAVVAVGLCAVIAAGYVITKKVR